MKSTISSSEKPPPPPSSSSSAASMSFFLSPLSLSLLLSRTTRLSASATFGNNDLFGLLHEKNPAGPGVHVEPDESVNIPQQVAPDDGGAGEAGGQRVHPAVETAAHEEERVAAEEVADGAGPALAVEDEPVRVRVGGEDGRLAEDVGGEERSEPGDPVVDEGLRIGGFVGGDELERLADEGRPEVSRREEATATADGGGAEEEEKGEEEEEEVE
ncbi:hypothetical protein STAS_23691 [Striga asiatica]|uniref:Uncharacterized protein n=1 Tax=Striga asiatica TaxID=4170 RepID=A0A5A7QNX8_STRAF|nr:hypothetical protein STAS_23691 [Striga asiatica]